MCGFCSTQVQAAESNNSRNDDVIAESSVDATAASYYAIAFGHGNHYWGGVTFTGTNGGAYKTINGN